MNNASRVIVETDILFLESAIINNPNSYFSSPSLIIQDCIDLLWNIPDCLVILFLLVHQQTLQLIAKLEGAGSESRLGV